MRHAVNLRDRERVILGIFGNYELALGQIFLQTVGAFSFIENTALIL